MYSEFRFLILILRATDGDISKNRKEKLEIHRKRDARKNRDLRTDKSAKA